LSFDRSFCLIAWYLYVYLHACKILKHNALSFIKIYKDIRLV